MRLGDRINEATTELGLVVIRLDVLLELADNTGASETLQRRIFKALEKLQKVQALLEGADGD